MIRILANHNTFGLLRGQIGFMRGQIEAERQKLVLLKLFMLMHVMEILQVPPRNISQFEDWRGGVVLCWEILRTRKQRM